MPFKGLKDTCNKLVGTWYCEELDQEYTFHLNEELFQTEGKLTIINSRNKHIPFTDYYGVGTYLNPVAISTDEFYIDIGFINKRYFKIDNLTNTLLVVREYWMEIGKPISDYTHVYKRKMPDISKADEILQGIGSDE